jgi:hypothetical protein
LYQTLANITEKTLPYFPFQKRFCLEEGKQNKTKKQKTKKKKKIDTGTIIHRF